MQQTIDPARLTDVERAVIDKCAARAQTIAVTRQNMALLEGENERERQAVLMGAAARIAAEDAAKAAERPTATGNAEVVELHAAGPAAAEAPAAA